MRRAVLFLILLVLPTAAIAQGTIKVTSAHGSVEWKAASRTAFTPLAASIQFVGIGDQIRTGSGAGLTLELPDGSYMVVQENTTFTIQQFWGSNLKNLLQVLAGRVRFHIQRFGGKPNPYRVNTPTAVIAVRGTVFEVIVDAGDITEVQCLEGRVAVESAGLPDREVILDQGRKTLVRAGEYPLAPVAIGEIAAKSHVIRVVRKESGEDVANVPVRKAGSDRHDNDRLLKEIERMKGPAGRNPSQPTYDIQRGKPTLKYPENQ